MNISIRTTTKRILMLATLSLAMTACQNTDNDPAGPEIPEIPESPETPETPATPATPEGPKAESESRVIVTTPAELEASKLSNRFAWGLLEQCITDNSQNVVLSPVSANICLSMVANATAGDSRAQILEALGMSDQTMDDVNSLNHKLAQQLCNLDDNVTMAMANSFWYVEIVNPRTDFLADLRDNYDIQAYAITPSTFVGDVNHWCSDQTSGLIPHLLDDDNECDFAFINAMYFRGYWSNLYRFAKEASQSGEFYNAEGTKDEVSYMNNSGYYAYYQTEQWRAMQIPFGGGGYTFTVILPNDGYTPEQCIKTIRDFGPSTGRYSSRYLDITMPKFKMEQSIDLVDILKAMGILDIFDYTKADFSNMTSWDAYVDMAKQCVNFEIDEEGAEAAAVTVIEGECTSTGEDPVYEPFVVDRPFIFMISEQSTGAILFMGRINNFMDAHTD